MNTQLIVTVQLPMAAVTLVFGALLALIPGLTRPSLFFSVTVPPSLRNTPEGRRIAGRYRALVIAGTVFGLALALTLSPARHPRVAPWPPIVVLVVALAAFLDARRRVLPRAVAPSPEREVELSPRTISLPGGWPGQGGPFALLAAAAAWLGLHWEKIPARFPVHWGIDGRPNGWAPRTPAGVFASLAGGAAVCALLVLIAFGITRWSRRIHAAGAAGKRELHFKHLVLIVLLASEYVLAAVNGWVALLPLTGLEKPGLAAGLILGLTTLLMIALVFVLVRTGQGGSRLDGPAETGSEAPTGDRSDDRYWKTGLFYVNRNDPAIFVEKRFGIGYTVNFGNPWSWAILGLIILPALMVWILVR